LLRLQLLRDIAAAREVVVIAAIAWRDAQQAHNAYLATSSPETRRILLEGLQTTYTGLCRAVDHLVALEAEKEGQDHGAPA
jgi:hypothetical protein